MNIFQLDLDGSLEDQGPFDLILHKMTDQIGKANQGNNIAKSRVQRFCVSMGVENVGWRVGTNTVYGTGVEKGDRQVKGVGWIVGKRRFGVRGEGGRRVCGVDGEQRQVWRWKGLQWGKYRCRIWGWRVCRQV